MNDLSSVSIVLRESEQNKGYTIKLGDCRIGATYIKLNSMLLTWSEVRRMTEEGNTKSGGTIDVSIPESPIYFSPVE